MTDPPVRADGLCAREGCGKHVPTTPPKTMPKGLRPTFLQELAQEPFCSATCARAYHGCPAQPTVTEAKRREKSRPASRAKETKARRSAIRAAGGLPAGHKVSHWNYMLGDRCPGCREAFRVWQKARRQQAAGIPAAV